MTSTPGQQTPGDPPVIVIDGVPRSAADLKALAHDQAVVISDLLEAKLAHTVDDYWLEDDGTAFLRYSARGEMILWEVSIRTVKAAGLAKTIRTGQADDHAVELAEAQNEISQLREDLALRTRDFQDCTLVNAQLQNETDQARRELAAAQARVAELEAAGRTAP
jgi:hypothetical protein